MGVAMDLSDLLTSDGIIASLKAQSKKQVLCELANRASELLKLDQHDIFETLLQRERLGSTGVGQGVAIPHGKLAVVDKIVVLFARLETPIDFEAIDGEPVDLVFMILAPEDAGADHLKALSRISRLLREPQLLSKLRGSQGVDAIYSLLTMEMESVAA